MSIQLSSFLYPSNSNLIFSFSHSQTNPNTSALDRVYASINHSILNPNQSTPYIILTANCDYDGALIGCIDPLLREDEEDDLIRYFDSVTGIEED